jgi:hypothetical protein
MIFIFFQIAVPEANKQTKSSDAQGSMSATAACQTFQIFSHQAIYGMPVLHAHAYKYIHVRNLIVNNELT